MKNVRKLYFARAEDVPNSILPVLVYRSVLAANAAEKTKLFRERFKDNGWSGLWADTIYDYTHFHSNAHEVLGVAEGHVSLRLGGQAGSLLRLKAGDMVVLPAGVGHRRVGDDKGLKVVGAYPRGQSHFDMKRKGQRVPKVALPSTDPFSGADGPLVRAWQSADAKHQKVGASGVTPANVRASANIRTRR
jgi:uncharacterized protein YjlB